MMVTGVLSTVLIGVYTLMSERTVTRPLLFSSKGFNMSNEPNIVEIYIDILSRDVLTFIPAANMLDNGEDLPGDAIFITQININDVVDEALNLKVDELRARL